RLETPLRRTGAKGEAKFAPISWDAALDEITGRWKTIIAEFGPLALLGYAYSAHQGQLNRGLMLGFFHALGASRLIAGTVCDTCCEEAWNMTVGPVGGADPEAEVLPKFPPKGVAEIPGLAASDVERLAQLYGAAKRSFIRLGEGMTRLARGGEALRAVALLPGVTGAYGRRGGGALLLTVAAYGWNYDSVRKPSGPAATRAVNHLRLGDALLNMDDPPIRG